MKEREEKTREMREREDGEISTRLNGSGSARERERESQRGRENRNRLKPQILGGLRNVRV